VLRSEQAEATRHDGGGTVLLKKDVTPAATVRCRYGHLQTTVPPQVPVARLLVVSTEWTGGVGHASCKEVERFLGRVDDANALMGLTRLLVHFS
jgi:hypothetical protein